MTVTVLGALVGFIVLGTLLGGLLMWAGTKMAGVSGISFGKCVVTALAAAAFSWICSFVFSLLPVIGTFVGIVVGILVSMLIIKGMFSIRFGQAAVVWVFYVMGQLATCLVGVLTVALLSSDSSSFVYTLF